MNAVSGEGSPVATLPKIAGEQYVAALSERAADRRARAAFHELALAGLGAGSTIFDFGCGPGLDALHYAQRGHHVRAFDIDPRMGAAFAERCSRPMAAGQVQLLCTTYPEFLASSFAHASIDLITANFAPLNVVDDLPELFGKFHAMTRPGGRVIASLLNPAYLGDMRYGWWWRLRPQLARSGGYEMRGEAYTLYRWTPERLAALARPHFELRSVQRGLPDGRLARVLLRGWLSLHTSQFLFFEFTRRQAAG